MTFLFTDIEGSTSLWERSPDAMRDALAEHDGMLRRIAGEYRGSVFKTFGDAFCCAFARPLDALDAAIDAQRELAAHVWPGDVREIRVRMGIHTGTAVERDGDYFGPTVNRVARLMSIGNGGQVLVSSATAALLRGSLAGGVTLRDLGPHRLRDLSQPEPTFQVVAPGLRADFPALASLDTLPNNLPSQISSFVGRERELDELLRLLAEHRLVMIVGPGGMGKTRLALQVAAAAIERFGDGAWFVDLSTIADPALVAQTIATALNVIESGREAIGETLLRDLERKNVLLVVDNAEHVLAGVAPIVKAILTRCAGATVLATSREPLHLTGEQTFRLSALPEVPAGASASDLVNHDGTRLFLDRARSLAPDLTVSDGDAAEICALCRKLEGIPLAIELAAARVATLSFRQLNERLGESLGLLASRDTTVERHRTLRETIEWSYRLLSDEEKRALAALAIFAGGFTLEACEHVVPPESTPAIDLLQSLVEKSFVQLDASAEPPRFRSLDVIREFALGELAASGKAPDLAARHAHYYAEFAGSGRDLGGDAAVQWYVRLDLETPNLRAALAWCAEHEATVGARLALDLAPYWRVRVNITEARARIAQLLKAALEPPLRAALLCSASSFAAMQDDFDASLTSANEALALYQDLSDESGTADALFRIAEVEHRRGHLVRAKRLYEEARSLFAPSKNKRGEMLCTCNLGMLARQQGNYELARSLLQDALAHANAAGERRIIGDFAIALAWAYVYLDELPAAEEMFQKALEQKQLERDRYGECSACHGLATIALRESRLDEALTQFLATIDAGLQLRLQTYVFRGMYGVSAVFGLRGALEDAVRYLGLAEKIFRESGRTLRDSIAYDVASLAVEPLTVSHRAALLDEGSRLTVARALSRLRSERRDQTFSDSGG